MARAVHEPREDACGGAQLQLLPWGSQGPLAPPMLSCGSARTRDPSVTHAHKVPRGNGLLRKAPLGQRPIHPAFSVRVIAGMEKVSDEGRDGTLEVLKALVADVRAACQTLVPIQSRRRLERSQAGTHGYLSPPHPG
jgi:hypothetical protein